MITIKLVGGAKKSFNSEQLQIEKSDLSVNELLEHLLKIKPSNTSEPVSYTHLTLPTILLV